MVDEALELQKRILVREPPLLYEACKVNHFLDPNDPNCILLRDHYQLSKKMAKYLSDYTDLNRDDWTQFSRFLCKYLPVYRKLAFRKREYLRLTLFSQADD
jgi:hypothetical protein